MHVSPPRTFRTNPDRRTNQGRSPRTLSKPPNQRDEPPNPENGKGNAQAKRTPVDKIYFFEVTEVAVVGERDSGQKGNSSRGNGLQNTKESIDEMQIRPRRTRQRLRTLRKANEVSPSTKFLIDLKQLSCVNHSVMTQTLSHQRQNTSRFDAGSSRHPRR